MQVIEALRTQRRASLFRRSLWNKVAFLLLLFVACPELVEGAKKSKEKKGKAK